MTTPDHAISDGKILILATETCAYPGANSVGQAHSSYPANTYILRVRAPVLFPDEAARPANDAWPAVLRLLPSDAGYAMNAVGLFVTSRCNLSCRMCGIWREWRKHWRE